MAKYKEFLEDNSSNVGVKLFREAKFIGKNGETGYIFLQVFFHPAFNVTNCQPFFNYSSVLNLSNASK